MPILLQSSPNTQPSTHPSTQPFRSTQSFVDTMARCWHRPSLLGLELLWRWGLGIPSLLLLFFQGQRMYSALSASGALASTGIQQFSLQDSLAAAQILAAVAHLLEPPLRALALWLLPLLALAWALASGFGRMAVLRRYDPTLPSAPWMLVGIQLLRILTLGGSFALWFLCLHHIANATLNVPDPNLVTYFAQAIFLSLAVFTLWALSSWIFSAAPMIALLENKSMMASLGIAAWFGSGTMSGLRGKLVEINLVLGIVKLCLVVLAMVFSATLLPFQSELSPTLFYCWWIFVTLVYLAASDFFQVTRLIAFIDFWHTLHAPHAPESFPE